MGLAAGMAALVALAAAPSPAAERSGGGRGGDQPLLTVETWAKAAGGAAGAKAATMERLLLERAGGRGRLRVIVGLAEPPTTAERARGDRPADARRAFLRRLGGAAAGAEAIETLPYLALEADAATLRRVLADPAVTSVQEDALLRPALRESTAVVRAPELWAQGHAGRGQSVAVLDTGVDASHPMLRGKVVAEACFSTGSPGSSASLCPGGAPSALGPGAGRNCPATVAGCEHGTLVAAIAAGRSSVLSGVARDGAVVAIQVFSRFDRAEACSPGRAPCVSAYVSDIVRGLERALALRDLHRIAAVNLSLGSGSYAGGCDGASPALTAAVGRLRAAGVATVVAAGNEGRTGAVSFPACLSGVVAVGSTDDADRVSPFSNFGPQLDVMAPGSGITSAVPGGRYATASGTSAAAPHVAGAIALLRGARPAARAEDLAAAVARSPVQVGRGLPYVRPRLDLPSALGGLGGTVVARRGSAR